VSTNNFDYPRITASYFRLTTIVYQDNFTIHENGISVKNWSCLFTISWLFSTGIIIDSFISLYPVVRTYCLERSYMDKPMIVISVLEQLEHLLGETVLRVVFHFSIMYDNVVSIDEFGRTIALPNGGRWSQKPHSKVH